MLVGYRFAVTYTAATTATRTAATATARPTATASRLAAAGTLTTGTLSVGTLRLVVRLGLAGELNRNLALQNLLARQLSDGTLSLAGGRKVDESVTDRALGTRVLRD